MFYETERLTKKLIAFSLMLIENKVLNSRKMDEIIDEFVLQKERRKIIQKRKKC